MWFKVLVVVLYLCIGDVLVSFICDVECIEVVYIYIFVFVVVVIVVLFVVVVMGGVLYGWFVVVILVVIFVVFIVVLLVIGICVSLDVIYEMFGVRCELVVYFMDLVFGVVEIVGYGC